MKSGDKTVISQRLQYEFKPFNTYGSYWLRFIFETMNLCTTDEHITRPLKYHDIKIGIN